MTRIVTSLALALALSLAGTAAMACGADGCACCKDKDGKMESGKGHDMKGMKGEKPSSKPDTPAPSVPDTEHKH